jgi:hypothetical protein
MRRAEPLRFSRPAETTACCEPVAAANFSHQPNRFFDKKFDFAPPKDVAGLISELEAYEKLPDGLFSKGKIKQAANLSQRIPHPDAAAKGGPSDAMSKIDEFFKDAE